MGIATAAIVGGSLLGAAASKRAGDQAANASNAAVAEQRRQFDLTRRDLQPYMQSGTSALSRLNALMSGDMSGFETSPGYNFVRSEGLRDINNSFAARGGALSGNALRALAQFNSGLASNEFGNYFERNARLAGLGGSATNNAAAYGAQSASNIGNALIGGGNARASGVLGVNNAIQGGIGNYLYAKGAGLV